MAAVIPGDAVYKGAGRAIVRQNGIVIAKLFDLGDMTTNIKYPSKNIMGAGYFPIDAVDGDREITCSFTNNKFSVNSLKTTGASVTTGQTIALPVLNEVITVPSSSPYTVTLAKAASIVAHSETVEYADTAFVLSRVESAPTIGQYSIASGVLTFNAADADKTMVVNYDAMTTTATVGTLNRNDTIPVVEITHENRFVHPVQGLIKVVIRLYACKLNGELNIDGKRAEASQPKLTFTALDARADGNLGFIAVDLAN